MRSHCGCNLCRHNGRTQGWGQAVGPHSPFTGGHAYCALRTAYCTVVLRDVYTCCQHRLCRGTPIENRVVDLHSLFEYVQVTATWAQLHIWQRCFGVGWRCGSVGSVAYLRQSECSRLEGNSCERRGCFTERRIAAKTAASLRVLHARFKML